MVVAGVCAALLGAVVLFTSGWRDGDLLLDGPGVATWLQVLLDHWRADSGLYWMPEMWAGTPFFGLFPSFHMLMLMPLGAVVGSEAAVKTAIVAAQVVGACGCFMLGRSLWPGIWPAAAAGLLYGCHPYFIASGPLSGHEASVWVFAITPWLVWSLRKALRREGAHHVALAGLFAGFAILQQAEHAFALVLLCTLLVVVQAARARRTGRGPTGPAGVLFRAAAVVVVALGTTAHWLVPFLSIRKSFVLTSESDVKFAFKVLGGSLGQRPEAFWSRAGPSGETYDFDRLVREFQNMTGTVAGSFYLGLVCLILTLVTVVYISRRDDGDGTLTAILLASVLSIWLSLGPVPLAGSDLASQGRIIILAGVGGSAGLLVGTFLRLLQVGRWGRLAAVITAVCLFAMPYISPIVTIQQLVPFLQYIRFPRFYTLAALGVALGAAYPLSRVELWARRRKPSLAPQLSLALALALVGLFIVDISPYRRFYRIGPPVQQEAYQAMNDQLDRLELGARIAEPSYGDPQLASELIERGHLLTTGWPHPLAQKNVWALTVEAFRAPPGYRDAALGLSATGYTAVPRLNAFGQEPRRIQEVDLEPNPDVLPVVRTYEHVVALEQGELAPALAVALAQRNIGVVTGAVSAETMRGVDTTVVSSETPCATRVPGAVGNEVAMACAVYQWAGLLGSGLRSVSPGVGAVIPKTWSVEGLRGIGVWLDRAPGPSELSLYQLSSDGRSLEREVRRVTHSGYDKNGVPAFIFEPIDEAPGAQYAFVLRCRECAEGEEPRAIEVSPERAAGNLLVGDQLRSEGVLAFSLLYDRMDVADPPSTEVRASQPRPGQWRISVRAPRAALVVVSEAFFPGWKAKVDGRTTEVVEADGAFLGVPVPAGSHDISITFHRPPSTTIGRVITGATLLVSLLLVVIGGTAGGSRRRRVKPAGAGLAGRSPSHRNVVLAPATSEET